MKNIFRILFVALLITSAVIPGKAEMYKGQSNNGQRAVTAAGCTPSASFEWLDINNVKTRINSGGDMWWDLPAGTGSKYYIPANGSATSLFAGSLWIAGVDVNNQLKCAALRTMWSMRCVSVMPSGASQPRMRSTMKRLSLAESVAGMVE